MTKDRFKVSTNLLPEHRRQGFTAEVVDSTHPSDGGPVAVAWFADETAAHEIAADMNLKTAHIITENVYPPIPLRQFDWCAHDDNYEPPDSDGVGGGIVGWGKTEAEAITDYWAQIAEAVDWAEAIKVLDTF